MSEPEGISFWQKRIKELEYEVSRNRAYQKRLDRAKKKFKNLVMGTNDIEEISGRRILKKSHTIIFN